MRLPSGSRTVFHYFVSIETGKFVVWDELVSSTKSLIDKGVSHVSLGEQMGLTSQSGPAKAVRDETEMVPTVDTVRYSFLISLLLVHKHHVLLTGKITLICLIFWYFLFNLGRSLSIQHCSPLMLRWGVQSVRCYFE